MRVITAIESQKRAKKRFNVFLDGAFAFSLGRGVVEERGLHPGQVLSDSQIEELVGTDLFGGCLDAAIRLLSYRPRSEAEIRGRLGRRFEGETVERVILHLKARQMIDDAAFARFWRENRESFRPCSKRLLQMELRGKRVASEVIDEVLEGMEDEENAYRAAQRRARTLGKDYETFRRKLSAFLGRRGFGYGVINRTIERLWREVN